MNEITRVEDPHSLALEYNLDRFVNSSWTPKLKRWQVFSDSSGACGLYECGGVEVAFSFVGEFRTGNVFAPKRMKQRAVSDAIAKCRAVFVARCEAELTPEWIAECKRLYEGA